MRTHDSYLQHLERIKLCGRKFMLLNRQDLLGYQEAIIPIRCHSDYCRRCRRINLVDLRKMLYDSLARTRWRLVTLTYEQTDVDRTQLLRSCAHQFEMFVKRIRRQHPAIKFVRTLELHRSGYPHIHLIIDKYVPVAFLQQAWHEVGGGNADVQYRRRCKTHHAKNCKLCPKEKRPLTYKDAARYLTDEVSKPYQDPHQLGEEFWLAGRRSLSMSRNVKLHKPAHTWELSKILFSITDVVWFLADHRTQSNITYRNGMFLVGDGYRNDCPSLDQIASLDPYKEPVT